jgi:hypothetical protein
MKKNYKTEISNSIINVKDSLIAINNFKQENEKLSIALGNDYLKIVDLAQKVDEGKVDFNEEKFRIIDVINIKLVFDSIIKAAKGFLIILVERLKAKEKNIESLMPPEGYMWGKNLEIIDLMNSTIELLKRRGKQLPSKVLEKLPSILDIADKGKDVVISYKEKEELLLNYPVAEIVLEEKLKKKDKVTAKDLPFDPKYSIEYLKLFHSKRYSESNYDESNKILSTKK